MTQPELYQALTTLGLPVAYGEFRSAPDNPAPPPPFITYQYAYNSDASADNQTYVDRSNFQIELYSKTKDLANEAQVEALLKSLRLPYRKVEAWLASERLRQIVYEVQLIGG